MFGMKLLREGAYYSELKTGTNLCVFSIRACIYQFLNRRTVLLLCPRAVSHFKNLIRPCLTPLTCVGWRWGCDGAVPGWR